MEFLYRTEDIFVFFSLLLVEELRDYENKFITKWRILIISAITFSKNEKRTSSQTAQFSVRNWHRRPAIYWFLAHAPLFFVVLDDKICIKLFPLLLQLLMNEIFPFVKIFEIWFFFLSKKLIKLNLGLTFLPNFTKILNHNCKRIWRLIQNFICCYSKPRKV